MLRRVMVVNNNFRGKGGECFCGYGKGCYLCVRSSKKVLSLLGMVRILSHYFLEKGIKKVWMQWQ